MSTLTVQSSDGRLILETPLSARTLFSFVGESSYGELTYNKGDAILIFCEDMTEGWSLGMLVDDKGEERVLADSTLLTRGLIARGFYEYVPVVVDQSMRVTTSISESPELQLDMQHHNSNNVELPPDATVGAPKTAMQIATLSLEEEATKADETDGQHPAETYPNAPDNNVFESKPEAVSLSEAVAETRQPAEARTRQASLNLTRPQNAVEAYLFSNDRGQAEQNNGQVMKIIDEQWVESSAISQLSIPSYSHRPSTSKESEYTAYEITCVTSINSQPENNHIVKDQSIETIPPQRHCVHRRYNHFQHLDTILRLSFPLISIPALPEKKLTGRFTPDFLNVRRRDLERYLRRIIRHPLIRSYEALLDFLTNDDEESFQRALHRRLLRASAIDPYRFFEKVDHDGNCFDISDLLEESNEEVENFASHIEAVEKGHGVPSIRDALAEYRASTQNTGIAIQNLSHSLYKLIAGLAQPVDLPRNTLSKDLPPDSLQRTRYLARAHRMQNNDGAFCWKDDCKSCLSITKAIQEAAGAFNAIAGLYEANAQTVLLAPLESLMEIDLPDQRHKALVGMHRSAQSHLEEYLKQRDLGQQADNALEAKFETVLNSISAEIDQIHQQRQADLRKASQAILDGQIAFHERALAQLRNARSLYYQPRYTQLAEEGMRFPPRSEKNALAPSPAIAPLREPSTYGASGPSHAYSAKANILGSILAGGSLFSWRSASSAIRAQNGNHTEQEELDNARKLTSPSMAAANKFVQFLDWTTNSRGEQKKHLS